MVQLPFGQFKDPLSFFLRVEIQANFLSVPLMANLIMIIPQGNFTNMLNLEETLKVYGIYTIQQS